MERVPLRHSTQIHDRAIPKDVRETDAIVARIRASGLGENFVSARIWRLSPLGAEIVVPEGGFQWKKGQKLDLQVVIEGRRSEFSGLVVAEVMVDENTDLLGIRFLADKVGHERGLEERKNNRWVCSEEYLPRAIAPAPGRFNEFLGFQIRNISKDGLQLGTKIDNAFLIPGMLLSLSVNLPMVGEDVVRVEIVWINIGSDGANESLELGVKMLEPSETTMSMLGQYLVQFSREAELEQLIAEGFTPKNVALGISFFNLKSEAEYREVLKIRQEQVSDKTLALEDCVEPEDRLGRIILGRIGEKLVAVARVRYPTLQGSLDCEKEIRWKESWPRSDEVIEVDEILVRSPEKYQSDVILALFKYICTSCTTTARSNVLVYSNRHPGLFESIGWESLGRYRGDEVLLGNAHRAIKGKLTNPLRWNYVWRESALYLLRTGTLQLHGVDRVIMKVYLALFPIAKFAFRLRQMLSKIKH